MSWFLEGSGSGLFLGVDEKGKSSIWGDAEVSDPRLAAGDIDFDKLERIGNASCSWSVHSNDHHIKGLTGELNSRVLVDETKSIAAIRFHDNPDFVGVTIALPPVHFSSTYKLFRDVLLHSNLEYLIMLEFMGFKHPSGELNIPTIDEFLAGPIDGGVLISEEVSISIRRRKDT